MKNKLQFSDYTKNMYLNGKSKLWSYMNHLRINKLKSLFKKYNAHFYKIIEFGSYDLYFASLVSKFLAKHNCIKYTCSDLYDSKFSGEYNLYLLKLTKHNTAILRNQTKIKYNIVGSTGENICKQIKELYSSIFIFETLEHVRNEKQVIVNMNKLLSNNGLVFVSVPKEFGLMFLLKELGRLSVLGRTNHNFKEIIYASFGKLNKVPRIIGGHKGYDYRETIRLFQKNGFVLIEKKYYPNKLFSYGVILVFKKVK